MRVCLLFLKSEISFSRILELISSSSLSTRGVFRSSYTYDLLVSLFLSFSFLYSMSSLIYFMAFICAWSLNSFYLRSKYLNRLNASTFSTSSAKVDINYLLSYSNLSTSMVASIIYPLMLRYSSTVFVFLAKTRSVLSAVERDKYVLSSL